MVGTLVYMAPELLQRKSWGTGSDIYSLAITLNELVTGCVPFSDVRTTHEQLHTLLEATYNETSLTSAICVQALRPNTLDVCRQQDDGGGQGTDTRMEPMLRTIAAGWAQEAVSRPSACQVMAQIKEAALRHELDMSQMPVRQALLDAFDRACARAPGDTLLSTHTNALALSHTSGVSLGSKVEAAHAVPAVPSLSAQVCVCVNMYIYIYICIHIFFHI